MKVKIKEREYFDNKREKKEEKMKEKKEKRNEKTKDFELAVN